MRATCDDWTLDSETRELRRRDEVVHLSPKAFQLLKLLIENRPKVMSKDDLLDRIWPNTFVAEANLPSLINEIRLAIRDDAKRIVRTVFRHGYAFTGHAVIEAADPTIRSIVVLPFTNASRNPETDYLCDGMTESLINALTRLPEMRIIPRSTAFRFRGAESDLARLRKSVDADAAVIGRISLRGESVDVQCEMIDLRSDSQVLGQRFHSNECAAVEREIASFLVSHLRPRSNDEAYKQYLKGRYLWNRRDASGMRKAVDCFRAAIDADPMFAPAHAGVADAFVTLGSRDLVPSSETFPRARESAERATQLDPSLAAAHSAIGAVKELFDWDWKGAEESHLRAVTLDPQYATAAQWYALHLARRGRHDEANDVMEHALLLDPFSTIINTNAAFISYLARDYERAIEAADRVIELEPNYEGGHLVAGVACIQARRLDRAVNELQEAVRLSGEQPYVLGNLASAHIASGNRAAAEQIKVRLTEAKGYVSPVHIALINLELGDRGAAIEWLTRGVDVRSSWTVYLRTDPRFDAIRDDPRVTALIDRIGYDAS